MENNPIKKTLDLSIDEMEEIDIEFSHSDGSQLITFILGEEKYGLEILKVRELISYPEGLTRIPGMPDFIVGMFNLRGLVIPVMDLREKFGMPHAVKQDSTVIIIVNVEDKNIGLIVDAVADVIFIQEEDLQETNEMAVHVDTKFIKGVTMTKDEMVILLDIDHLLSKKEFDQLVNTKNE